MFNTYMDIEDHQLGLHTLLSLLAPDWKTSWWAAPIQLPTVTITTMMLEFDVTVNKNDERLFHLYWCSP